MTPRIFDAHLDLAMNALRGRDITLPAREQPVVENEIATVGLPDLRAGNVTHVCGTIFCAPATPDHPGYADAQGAYEDAVRQLDYYHDLQSRHEISIRPAEGNAPGVLILIEGADCVRSPDDLPYFQSRGVRIVGLAWTATRYAGGTWKPGPLTTAGRELVRHIDQLGLIHDASHLAEQSFFDLLNTTDQVVIASHSNCRAIVGVDEGERHLSDEMIRAIVARGGVIGINAYDRFLLPAGEYKTRRATIADMIAHVRHVCDLAGDADHVGIGTDMDGGLGREQVPVEFETIADLPKLHDALLAAGFGAQDVEKILFANWRRLLPGTPGEG